MREGQKEVLEECDHDIHNDTVITEGNLNQYLVAKFKTNKQTKQ